MIDLFYGNGLDYRNKANTQGWLKLKAILNHKELRKLISDFVIFNECSFQVGKNKTKKILVISTIYQKIRSHHR